MLAIYLRLSKEDKESTSIENQLREGKQFAKKNNLQFTIYNEGEGVSGTLELADRPKLFELISDVKSGNITSVWMRNQNRLDRNTATFYLFVSAVKTANVTVNFGDGATLDFNDPNTLLTTTIISSLNQYTAQLQSLQTKRALKDSAKEGKAWGVIPYGYSTDKEKQIIINETQAETVKEMFNLSLSGWGVARIATHLNEKGVPTKYNGYKGTFKTVNKYDKTVTTKSKSEIVWSAKTVLDILRNTWYIGQRTYSGNEYPTPPIIETALFDKVSNNLKTNRNNSGKKVEYRYLLKGLLRCGKCGRNYYGRVRQSKNDNFYMCSSKRVKALNCGSKAINIPYLETFVIKHLFQSKDLENHLKQLDKKDNSLIELETELTDVNASLKKEIVKNNRLAELLIEDLSDDKVFLAKYKQSKDQITTYEARIKSIESGIKERSNKDRVKAYSNEVGNVDLSNFTALKESVNNIIERIEVSTFVGFYNNDVYQIEIKYRGFNVVSIFQTSQPYHEWNYDGGLLLEPNEYDKEYDKPNTNTLSTIYLDENDLIHFN